MSKVSTKGLVRKPTFEEVLAASIKDEQNMEGLLSVGMQRYATNAINSPLFQRMQDAVESDLEKQQTDLIRHNTFQNNVQSMSAATGVPHGTLQHVVQNIAQPPPPPPMPPTITSSSARGACTWRQSAEKVCESAARTLSHTSKPCAGTGGPTSSEPS